MNPHVSIIVPCYNQAEYLSECLQSVLDQNYTNWECLIVNDGSSDNTERIALQWTTKDTRFKYFRKENGGLSNARNFGIIESKGKYILPLDCDDKIGKDYVKLGVSILNNDDSIGVVYCNARFFGVNHRRWILPTFDKKYLLCSNLLFCSAIYRKKDWELIGGYDENMKYGWEDWEFWINLIYSLNRNVHKLKYEGFYYRQKANSMVTAINKNKNKQQRMYSYIYEKHKGFYEEAFQHPIICYRKVWRWENKRQVLIYYIKKTISFFIK